MPAGSPLSSFNRDVMSLLNAVQSPSWKLFDFNRCILMFRLLPYSVSIFVMKVPFGGDLPCDKFNF